MSPIEGDPDWGFIHDPAWAGPASLRCLGWSLAINVADGLSQHRDASFVWRGHMFNPLATPAPDYEVLIAGDPELSQRQVDVSASVDGATRFKPKVTRFRRVNYTAVVAFPGGGLASNARAWINVTWSWPHSANVDGGQWVRGLRSLVEGGAFEVVLRHPVEVAQRIGAWVANDDGGNRRHLDAISVHEADGYQVTRIAGTREDDREQQLRITTEPLAAAEDVDQNQALLRGVAHMHDQALRAIRQIGALMQEYPDSHRESSEENLRGQVVTALDMAGAGQVTGESFSRRGKTDIMIRHEGASILLVECKKWKKWEGPKRFHSALDQLLGYAAIHQSRLAVLMFITGGPAATARRGARETLEARPDFHSWESNLRDDHLRAVLQREPEGDDLIQLAVIFVFLT